LQDESLVELKSEQVLDSEILQDESLEEVSQQPSESFEYQKLSLSICSHVSVLLSLQVSYVVELSELE